MPISDVRHMRFGLEPPGRWKGKCGDGYDWPSTIALTEDTDKVTCLRCLSLLGADTLNENQVAAVREFLRKSKR